MAFITFKSQEGYERCVENAVTPLNFKGEPKFLKGKQHLEILGKNLECLPAPEPSDIIWENLYVPQLKKHRNKVCILAVLFCFLFCVFMLFMYLDQWVIQTERKYPGTE